jgi:hypothetical protein
MKCFISAMFIFCFTTFAFADNRKTTVVTVPYTVIVEAPKPLLQEKPTWRIGWRGRWARANHAAETRYHYLPYQQGDLPSAPRN